MKVNPSDSESVADVMKRVSHAELLSHYMGIDSLPVLINSPLRDDDKHPSFFIYSPDGNKVLYKDYATGDNGDIYSLLKSVKHKTFAELIRTIASEKSFVKTSYTNRSSQDRKKIFKTTTNIQVKIREWKQHDVEYWQSYGISVKWLKYAEVYPISHKIIYKGNQRYVFPAAKYAYVFVEHKENNVSLKIYQPFNKTFKWVTSNNGSVVGLWTKIPKIGEKICICSSLKDALCLWANIGIPSIYVQSETTGLSNTAQEVLKHRFKHIYICFDNDEAGLVDGKNLSEKTGFKNVVLPFFKGGKDISDAYKLFGKEWLLKNVKGLFENGE
jgi:hypothetical protein